MKTKLDTLIKQLAVENSRNFNFSKLAEELTELSEICIKQINKRTKAKQPTIENFSDECGDVLLRTHILIEMLGIEKQVIERMRTKGGKLSEYRRLGKYKKHI